MARETLPDSRMRLAAPIAACLALWLLGGLPAARVAVAQSALQAAIEQRGPVSPEKRAELLSRLGSQAEILQAQTAVVKTVVKLVGPTVVHIEADVTGRTALQFGRSHQVEEAGSGVIVRFGDGYFVLTNRHLINGASAENIDVHLADGRLIHPVRTWEDAETDVAVMAVSAPDLVAASIGDSDSMEIGDFVLAVGSPFGLSHSVTYGMISAMGRRGLQLGKSGVHLQNFLQTDAAINPGNSGGPLVNLRGEVIGINTAIASNSGGSEGIGFSIPINMFAIVARQLVENGKVRRAFLGVNLDVNFGPAEATRLGLPRLVGARINGVRPQSPAAAASLQEGDVILKVGNTLIEDDSHLVDVMQLTEVGTKVPLVIFRNRQELQVNLTAGDWEEFNSRG